jgi:hypothetical protein
MLVDPEERQQSLPTASHRHRGAAVEQDEVSE